MMPGFSIALTLSETSWCMQVTSPLAVFSVSQNTSFSGCPLMPPVALRPAIAASSAALRSGWDNSELLIGPVPPIRIGEFDEEAPELLVVAGSADPPPGLPHAAAP